MIRISNLLKMYDERVILNNLSLEINKGVIFGLLGPNGAGKTTLVSILNGLSDFQEGEISIFDLPLRENIKTIRQRSSLIPQKLAFYENLTVMENLYFFGGVQNIRGSHLNDTIAYSIHTSRLESVLDQKAHTLSGGQKRRLNLAIGLLNNPDILFFDEPTVGIDPEARNEILDTILLFKKEKKTVIYTSHYMQEIEKICDEVAIINHGEIIAKGTLEEMLEGGNTSNAIIEIHETPLTQLLAIAKEYEYLTAPDSTSLIVKEKNSRKIAEIINRLEVDSIDIRQIRYETTSLESLFIQLTTQGKNDA